MRHIWKAQMLGAGMLTPALAGLPHAAAARSVDMDAHGTVSSLGVCRVRQKYECCKRAYSC